MKARQKPTHPINPMVLDAVYRVSDIQDILGIGKHTMAKLKRAGLPVRRTGNKDFVLSNDLWEAMAAPQK